MNSRHLGVVLVSPEIPQNAGNIARLCAACSVTLHLIRPLGFFVDDKHMKRAGLDYWNLVDVIIHDDFNALMASHPSSRLVLASTKASKIHSDETYRSDDLLVFGPESKGLSKEILSLPQASVVRIPMAEGARSLNLANSVAIVLYEAMRQLGYPGMTFEGPGW